MKKTEVVAKDKNGVEVGRKTVEFPENLDEAIKLEGSEDAVLNHYLHAKKIFLRSLLYTRTAISSAGSKKAVYEKAVAAGCSKAVAIQVSGYNPDAPVAVVK